MPLIIIYPREALHEMKYCFVRQLEKLANYGTRDGICVAPVDGSETSGLELLVQHRRFVLTASGRQVLSQVECCLHAHYYAAIRKPHELDKAAELVAKYGFHHHVPRAAHPEMSG
jgi:hypothetical protein